jgi:histone deacetylase 3
VLQVVTRQENANSKQYLEAITRHVYDNLKMIQHSPSVQMQDVPGDLLPSSQDSALMEDLDPDTRLSQAEEDRRVEPPNEFYDGDTDQDKPDVSSAPS